MSTVFLFGAGASYGSDTGGRRPPLGADLFRELAAFNPPGWGTITGNLAEEFQRDFEAAFATVQPHAYGPLLRAMALYFFQFVPRPTNLYFDLAQRIRRANAWSVAVCSLNYERLLELSLSGAGIRPAVGGPSNQASQVELCLPHGCCHLFCDSVRAVSGMVSFAGGMVQTNGPIIVIGDPAQHRARIEQDAMPPVMSYFETAKRTTSGASFIDGQRARWHELAACATVLVIVGVRVREHDNHIWDPISASGARVVYCAGATAALEYEAWAGVNRPGRDDVVLRGYFADEFGTLCAHAGL